VLIIHILKKIGKIYSKVTLNYFLVVVSDSVFIILANLLKYISYAIKDQNSKLILLQISSFIAAGTGIAIGLSRLYNKRLLSELLWKLRKKPKVSLSHSINSHQSESDSSLLMSNIYNMGDLFESITSKSLAQMLITIFIKSSEYKIEVEHENEFDEFLFNEENFRELSGELGVRSINESN
jgi:tellurite resistance protein TehA-like permease